jgi:hypothetical protein
MERSQESGHSSTTLDARAHSRTGPEAETVDLLRTERDDARSLAAEYEQVVAAQADELMALKAVFEKSRQHLIRLQLTVNGLQEEKRRMAESAAQAEAQARKITLLTVERDRLREQLEARDLWKG